MKGTQNTKKGIIYILLIMIIGMSIMFYYYLVNIDKRYNQIIKYEIALYNNIQDLTFRANRGYLLLYKINEISDRATRDSLINQKHLLMSKNDSLIDEILLNLIGNKDKFSLNQLINSRQEYVKNCARFEDYLTNSNRDSANYILLNKIEPSFLKYQTNLISFIDSNTVNVLENSGNITSDVKRNSSIVLLLGLSPVIIFSIFLLILGILIIIMVLFIKDIEYDRFGE
jgi:hypothetical protein